MSTIEEIGAVVGSRRYARDLIESTTTLLTRPWWDGVQNTWEHEHVSALIRARTAHGHSPRGIEHFKIPKDQK